jgi:hypothetical protein
MAWKKQSFEDPEEDISALPEKSEKTKVEEVS